MMKVFTIIGARPQFVKAAALSRQFEAHKDRISEVIVHTGQHFDKNMSDVFFTEMEIPRPQYNLNINGLNHGAMTGQMLEKLEPLMIREQPDWVLVYGDTNSTLAGALAARKLHFRVVHVEAGLRSFNMRMPEEVNRILTDRISDLLLCPTDEAVKNLEAEGFRNFGCRIEKTGDVMEDAARYYAKKASEVSTIIRDQQLQPDGFVLATIHRAENTDNPAHLRSIVQALETINKTVPVAIPLHPRTRKLLSEHGIKTTLRIFEPVGYFDMLELIRNSRMIVTDSGGLQKEAFFFRKYCVTAREQTEWVELVDNGYNRICGTDEALIVKTAMEFLDKPFPEAKNLYGNGNACVNICNSLLAS